MYTHMHLCLQPRLHQPRCAQYSLYTCYINTPFLAILMYFVVSSWQNFLHQCVNHMVLLNTLNCT